MLDLKFVCENMEEVRHRLRHRAKGVDWSGLMELAGRRRELIGRHDGLRQELNQASKAMRGPVSEEQRERLRGVSEGAKEAGLELRQVEEALEGLLLRVPNMPHESVPQGADEEGNVEVRRVGEPPEFSFVPRDHVDLGEGLGILDIPRATKVAASRFSLLQGAGARLEWALVSFMLDLHAREHGYLQVLPPFMVNKESMTGTGQLPNLAEDCYKIEGEDLYLVPTAEVPVTNIHRDEVMAGEALPRCYVAYTPCFRREAGSHGKDVRGLIRQHQFNKVELVRFCRPERSYEELEILVSHAEEVLKRLGLAYRVMALSAGDMGFSAAKCYDIEVWVPSQGRYREISSCSNFEDFQARRAKIRYKEGKGKPALVHTLNGSGLAVGRTLVALLENYQREDGSVELPEILAPYMGATRIEPRVM